MNNNYEQGYFSIKNKAIIELKPNVFRTYCYLVSKDFTGNGIWHSQQTISTDLKKSIRTVQRHIKVLKDLGYISVKRRGFNQTNLMRCLIGVVEKVKAKKEEMTNNFKKSFATSKNKSKKLKFDNFTGRDYSKKEMDSLELKLLGWD
jgi:DNA-binding transcriptional ArsR family regulator